MRDYKEIFLIINLFPFIYSKWKYLSKLIIINGTLYHGSIIIFPKYTNILRKWDVLCNLLAGIYVNYSTSWQPYTIIFTLLAVVSWKLNKYFNNNKLIHAFFVQNPLCICSYYN